MVDDNMEISSDHGLNAGDEDIDIDIDITAAQVDEDYVLEDAASNVDLGDNTTLQPSPLVVPDDLMIDEDDESYSMNDADLIHDGQEQNMEDEAAAMSFVTVNNPHFNGNEITATEGVAPDYLGGQSELMWEQGDEQLHPEEPDVQLEDSENTLLEESNNKILEPVKADYDHDSRTVTPRQVSPENLAVEEPRSPSASNPGRHSTSPHGGSHHSDASHSTQEVSNVEGEAEHLTSSDNADTLHAVHDIVVLYQSGEYALFGKSDSDDPDSFFLSDLSIADKTISDFFNAMREVIHEDLTPEEELCISVDDLGLEIEETVSSLHDITLSQILNLHEKLLQNDGVQLPRPLCLGLGTRPSFARRLANFMAGAADGKGLSQLVTWDEQSEEYNESGEAGEDLQNSGALGESELASESFSDEAEATFTKLPEDGEADLPAQETAQEQPLLQDGHVQEHEDDHLSPSNATLEDTQQDTSSAVHGVPTKDMSYNGEYDEDGDLIDYSDEEDQNSVEKKQTAQGSTDDNRVNNGTTDLISPCLKPNVCFCSKCSDVLLAEYEAINEELRRRSISRTADETLLEKAKGDNSAASSTPIEAANQQQEVENEDEWDRGDVEESHEYLIGELTEATLGINNDDYDDLIDDEVGGDDETSAAVSSRNAPDHEGEEYAEDPFGDDDEFRGPYEDDQHGNLPRLNRSPHNETSALDNGENEAQKAADSKSRNLGTADAANSSATVSADESHLDDGLGTYGDLTSFEHEEIALDLDHKDEIDYEDDEEEEVSKAANVLQKLEKLSPTTNGVSGKRARTDSDETMSTSKDAKRPRS